MTPAPKFKLRTNVVFVSVFPRWDTPTVFTITSFTWDASKGWIYFGDAVDKSCSISNIPEYELEAWSDKDGVLPGLIPPTPPVKKINTCVIVKNSCAGKEFYYCRTHHDESPNSESCGK